MYVCVCARDQILGLHVCLTMSFSSESSPDTQKMISYLQPSHKTFSTGEASLHLKAEETWYDPISLPSEFQIPHPEHQ